MITSSHDMHLTPLAAKLLLTGKGGVILQSAISEARRNNVARVEIYIEKAHIATIHNPDLSKDKAFKRIERKYRT